MKFAVLGAAGHMGRSAVAAALKLPFVEQLVIADRDGDGASRLADATGSVKAHAVRVDVTHPEQLRDLLGDCDAVISTVGPFFRFGTTILRAALASGCHYIDICDDPGPTLELLELDQTAQKAGLCAIVGAGASPGISNLLAVKAIGDLDEVDTLLTGWGTGGRQDESGHRPEHAPAAIEHWIRQLIGPIPIWADGKRAQGEPLEAISVRLPGREPVIAYTVGHPEPVTLPRYYPSIRHCLNVMDIPPAVLVLVKAAAHAVESGRLSMTDATRSLAGALYGGRIGPGGALGAARALAAAARERLAGKQYLPQLFAVAIGRRGNSSEMRAAYIDGTIPGGMGALTCIPATIMLAMLEAGEIQRRGVFAPEAGVDPECFFARLEPHVARESDERKGPVRILIEVNQ
jgi:saccharopine dehydrogenase-like NADP-dependent oxidoreductase